MLQSSPLNQKLVDGELNALEGKTIDIEQVDGPQEFVKSKKDEEITETSMNAASNMQPNMANQLMLKLLATQCQNKSVDKVVLLRGIKNLLMKQNQ